MQAFSRSQKDIALRLEKYKKSVEKQIEVDNREASLPLPTVPESKQIAEDVVEGTSNPAVIRATEDKRRREKAYLANVRKGIEVENIKLQQEPVLAPELDGVSKELVDIFNTLGYGLGWRIVPILQGLYRAPQLKALLQNGDYIRDFIKGKAKKTDEELQALADSLIPLMGGVIQRQYLPENDIVFGNPAEGRIEGKDNGVGATAQGIQANVAVPDNNPSVVEREVERSLPTERKKPEVKERDPYAEPTPVPRSAGERGAMSRIPKSAREAEEYFDAKERENAEYVDAPESNRFPKREYEGRNLDLSTIDADTQGVAEDFLRRFAESDIVRPADMLRAIMRIRSKKVVRAIMKLSGASSLPPKSASRKQHDELLLHLFMIRRNEMGGMTGQRTLRDEMDEVEPSSNKYRKDPPRNKRPAVIQIDNSRERQPRPPSYKSMNDMMKVSISDGNKKNKGKGRATRIVIPSYGAPIRRPPPLKRPAGRGASNLNSLLAQLESKKKKRA